MAQITTLTDTFTGTTIDTTKWTVTNSAGGATVSQNNQLILTTSTTIGSYCNVKSATSYDFTGVMGYIQVASAGNQALPNFETNIIIIFDATNQAFYNINANTLNVVRRVASVDTVLTSIPYSSTNHQWLAFYERDGRINFQASTNGINWKQICSCPNPWAVTALTFEVEAGIFAATASTTTAQYDNFNLNGNSASRAWSKA